MTGTRLYSDFEICWPFGSVIFPPARVDQELLLLVRTLSACDRSSSGGGSDEPSWSALQGLAYAVFETFQSLLSVPSFVAVTQELLQHQVNTPFLVKQSLHDGGLM